MQDQQIRAALRTNEIGDGDPYGLSFAELGESGASFGVFQADVAANHDARATLLQILVTAGVAGASGIISQLAQPLTHNPLDSDTAASVSVAMASDAGRAAIDALDEVTFSRVIDETQTAIDAASAVGKTLESGAVIAVALWSNMTGLPSTLDRWIGGETIAEAGGPCAPPAGPVVTQTDVMRYLSLSVFFGAHPRNLAHFEASIAMGLAA